MIRKANINWAAKQMCKMIDNGKINFDNYVQRSLVWDVHRKSLLIHSMIEGYPIPAFYAVRTETGYDMLDGKQRSNAINDFLAGKYSITDAPEVYNETEQAIDINGKKYEDLPEDIRDAIKDYSLTVYYFESLTDEEIAEMFFRLNNGKPLSAIELTRVKAKAISAIKEIGSHPLLETALSDKAIAKYTNEDIAMKAWVSITQENPSFETKVLRPIIESADITETDIRLIKSAFDRIYTVHQDIISCEDKESQKVAKRVITRTHLLAIVPITIKSINDKVDTEDFSGFIMTFFNSKDGTSINESYNGAIGRNTARTESVSKRITAVAEEYSKYFNK